MSLQPIESQAEKWIESQDWIDSVGDPVQSAIHSAYQSGGAPGKKVANFLNGTWLGHPLHPVITDVSIGAWTVTVFLDALESATGRHRYGKSAQAVISVGIISALAAAVAGLTDWQHLTAKPKRVGAVHALLNILSLFFFSASLAARRRRKRQAGRQTALMGFGLATLAAYLGGNLVYKQKIGVNHATLESGPAQFSRVIELNQLEDQSMKKADWNGIGILLTRNGNQVYAIGNVCSHLGGPLSQGKLLDDLTVVCPLHQSRFSTVSGELVDGPSTYSQPCFETRIQDGWVEIRRSA